MYETDTEIIIYNFNKNFSHHLTKEHDCNGIRQYLHHRVHNFRLCTAAKIMCIGLEISIFNYRCSTFF